MKEENETSPRKYNLRHTPQRDDHLPDNHPAKSKSKEKKDPSVAADGSDMLKLLWNTSTSALLMDQEVFSVERICPPPHMLQSITSPPFHFSSLLFISFHLISLLLFIIISYIFSPLCCQYGTFLILY